MGLTAFLFPKGWLAFLMSSSLWFLDFDLLLFEVSVVTLITIYVSFVVQGFTFATQSNPNIMLWKVVGEFFIAHMINQICVILNKDVISNYLK